MGRGGRVSGGEEDKSRTSPKLFSSSTSYVSTFYTGEKKQRNMQIFVHFKLILKPAQQPPWDAEVRDFGTRVPSYHER